MRDPKLSAVWACLEVETRLFAGSAIEAGWRAFEGRIGEMTVGCALTNDGPNADVGVTCVATTARARGQQVASRLLSFALRCARERGMRTTTLQATSKGKHLYARLGYEDLGAIEMWEHRVPPPT